MSKFKIGDKVRMISREHSYVKFGEIGTIVHDDKDGSECPYQIDWEKSGKCYANTNKLELFKEEPKMFWKKDLKVGMLLVRRDGSKRIIYQTKSGDLFATLDEGSSGGWIDIRDYNEDLKSNPIFGNPNLDIMKVYDLPSEGTRNLSYENERNVLWERIEPVVKEMTVEEIAQALGYDVKVVK